MILLNFGWMVDLAMSIFEFLTKFLILWHPWQLWGCIRSVSWKWNLKQIEAIPPSVWRFIIPNELEQIWFKLEKLLWFRNMQEKLKNVINEKDKCNKGSHYSDQSG